MANKQKSKAQRAKEFAESAAAHLIELSKQFDYPLNYANWHALTLNISEALKPHHLVADETVRVDIAEKRGVDIGDIEAHIAAWREENDLMTAEEFAQRHGLLLGEVIAAHTLGIVDFVRVPDEVVGKSNQRYRKKDDHRNYPRSAVEALTREDLTKMSEAATMTLTQATEYLRADPADVRGWLAIYTQPVGKTERFNAPLYSILSVRQIETMLARTYPEKLQSSRQRAFQERREI